MDYDAVVIGSGAGGGSAAHRLVQAGWRVLVLERGEPLDDPGRMQDEWAMPIDRIASDDRGIAINGRAAGVQELRDANRTPSSCHPSTPRRHQGHHGQPRCEPRPP